MTNKNILYIVLLKL